MMQKRGQGRDEPNRDGDGDPLWPLKQAVSAGRQRADNNPFSGSVTAPVAATATAVMLALR